MPAETSEQGLWTCTVRAQTPTYTAHHSAIALSHRTLPTSGANIWRHRTLPTSGATQQHTGLLLSRSCSKWTRTCRHDNVQQLAVEAWERGASLRLMEPDEHADHMDVMFGWTDKSDSTHTWSRSEVSSARERPNASTSCTRRASAPGCTASM